jgi:hypothetical protein
VDAHEYVQLLIRRRLADRFAFVVNRPAFNLAPAAFIRPGAFYISTLVALAWKSARPRHPARAD